MAFKYLSNNKDDNKKQKLSSTPTMNKSKILYKKF